MSHRAWVSNAGSHESRNGTWIRARWLKIRRWRSLHHVDREQSLCQNHRTATDNRDLSGLGLHQWSVGDRKRGRKKWMNNWTISRAVESRIDQLGVASCSEWIDLHCKTGMKEKKICSNSRKQPAGWSDWTSSFNETNLDSTNTIGATLISITVSQLLHQGLCCERSWITML